MHKGIVLALKGNAMKPKSQKSKTIVNAVEIGLRMKAFRVKAGLTQESLAEQIGLSPQQIQKYEAGGSKLNTDKLQEFANAMDISIFEFFEGLGDFHYQLTADERRLITAFRKVKEGAVRNGYLIILENSVK